MRPGRHGAVAVLAILALGACGRGLDSESPATRAAAVRALASASDAQPLPALLVAQRDPSPLVRRAAAEVIARRRGPHAADALGAMLADGDAGVATAAAQGLARLGELEPARRALAEGYALASPAARIAIAAALEELGVSLRDAVEAEARRLWARNLAVLETGSPQARAGAIEELGASGRAEAVARLRALLGSDGQEHGIRIATLHALGEAGDPAVRPLLEAELEKGDPEIAEAAAHALGRLGDPAATAPLVRLASAGGSGLARAALEALAALPAAPEVSEALCSVAVRSQSPAIASRAARAAWGRNADCPASALAARAARGDAAAQAAIVELHPEPSVTGPLAAKLQAMVTDARAPSDRRRRAAVLLGQLGWSASGPAVEGRTRALFARLNAGRTGWVQGRIAGEPSLPAEPAARLAFLRDRPSTLPDLERDRPPPVPEWIDLTAPEDREELGALLAALGRLQHPSAPELLRSGASDPSAAVRAGAMEGLGHLGGEAPPDALIAGLGDPDAPVRLAALAVLPRYGARAVPALAAAAGRSDLGARWLEEVARALGQTGAPDAIPPLVALLRGPAPGPAATALAAIGVDEAVGPLLAHLSDPSARGRVEALDALAQLGARNAGPVIELELLSERPEVRIAAARAIGRLRLETGSGRLEALRADYDGRVRRAATEALARLPSGRPRTP